ncbi:hypothetical protein ACH40E_06535 [Streptomyces acidicola]|uniref:hypothetical protein n=1 Tax=Streptomyces acidicola TaxID=2596892 RepID=UPI0037B17796
MATGSSGNGQRGGRQRPRSLRSRLGIELDGRRGASFGQHFDLDNTLTVRRRG